MSGLCLADCQEGGIFTVVFSDESEITGEVIKNYGGSMVLKTNKGGVICVSNDALETIHAYDDKTKSDWLISIDHSAAIFENYRRGNK